MRCFAITALLGALLTAVPADAGCKKCEHHHKGGPDVGFYAGFLGDELPDGPAGPCPCYPDCPSDYHETAVPPPLDAPPAVRILLIGLTNDKNLGTAIGAGLDRLQQTLEASIPENRRGPVAVVKGDDVTPDKITEAVDDLDVGPRDVVLCYYLGRGGVKADEEGAANAAGGAFLVTAKGNLPRKTLADALKARKARLTILLTDACNDFAPVAIDNALPAAPPVPGNGILGNLLFQTTGSVDVDASSKGQTAWCEPEGGCFTLGLLDAMNKPQDFPTPAFPSWRNLLKKASEATNAHYRNYRRQVKANKDAPKNVVDALKKQPAQTPQALALETVLE